MALHPGDPNFADYPTGDDAVAHAEAQAATIAAEFEDQNAGAYINLDGEIGCMVNGAGLAMDQGSPQLTNTVVRAP